MSVKKNTTIIDLARIANVSKSTVSRVLSGGSHCSSEAQRAVYEAVQKTGYKVNTVAQNLRQGKSSLVGAIIPDISNSFFSQIILAAQMIAKKHKLSLMIFNTHESIEEEFEALEILTCLNVYGILLVTAVHKEHTYNIPNSINIPTIFIDRKPFDKSRFTKSATVTTDDRKGGLLAAKKMNEVLSGKAKILVLKDSREIANSESRYLAFREFFRGTVHKVSMKNVDLKDPDLDNIINICKKKDINCIFCTTDIIAHKIVNIFNEYKFSIPSEIKILGFDGSSWADKTYPTLATIAQNTHEIGVEAISSLINLANNKYVAITKNINPYFISGGTLV